MKKLRIGFVLIFGLMAAPVTSTVMAGETGAATFSDGLAAYIKGDNAAALRVWGPLAKQGNRDAQYHIGRMYQTGNGVKMSQEQAYRWYSLAAKNGHVTASYKVKHWRTEKRKVAYTAF